MKTIATITICCAVLLGGCLSLEVRTPAGNAYRVDPDGKTTIRHDGLEIDAAVRPEARP